MKERYWIDERHDCIVIRDRCVAMMMGMSPGWLAKQNPQRDDPDVVFYVTGTPTGCQVMGAIMGWDMTDAREQAEERLRELNEGDDV